MIVVRFKGGFGNQLFQYAAGKALAARHGVGLAFDSRWYERAPHQEAVRRSFDLMNLAVQGKIATRLDLQPFFYDGNHLRASRTVGRLIRPLFGRSFCGFDQMGYAPEFEHLGRRVLLEGYFQDPRYFVTVEEKLRSEFHLLLPPPPELRSQAAALSAQPSVCLQVRRTDLASNAKAAAVHGMCSLEYYKRAWSNLRDQVPGARGFVFTDDADWAREAFQDWLDVSVVGPEWDGPDYMHKFFLMQSCRHFIIANSTWGWWTAWLGSFPGKKVIMPEQWFADPALNEAAVGLRVSGWLQC